MTRYISTREGGLSGVVIDTGMVQPTFGANIVIDLRRGTDFIINATSNITFFIANPLGVPHGDPCQRLSIQVRNLSSGALGIISFGTAYRLGGAFVLPGAAASRSIEFRSDATNLLWIERSRTAADVPN